MGSCALQIYISWISPPNIPISDVIQFAVYTDEKIRVVNASNEPMMSIYDSMCSCAPHNISVSARNHCGHPGQRSPNITVNPEPLIYNMEDNQLEVWYFFSMAHE